ncbi:MAG TPA: hypothetical protein VNQ80_08705 [Parapedobacter sp.]|uniref:hypothetical protein n=1 Tax=Parapedobacter sp. TaxID=1958893 RepID=UPI002CE255E2|nr:hypothetical protein [Parapedobacter sp.]HWK57403.1 hypothetical protein [Parapedobacter sp.]
MNNESYIGFFGFLGYKRSYAVNAHRVFAPLREAGSMLDVLALGLVVIARLFSESHLNKEGALRLALSLRA